MPEALRGEKKPAPKANSLDAGTNRKKVLEDSR
jgi:hypothetical protein